MVSKITDNIANLLIEAEIIQSDKALSKEFQEKFSGLKEKLIDLLDETSKESLEDLQVAIDAAPCTISWVNSDLNYLGVNKVLADICHIDQKDFIGKPVGFFTHESIFAQFTKELFDSPKNRVSKELSSTIDDKDHWYYIVGRKYKNNQLGVLIGIDITDQKISQQQMILQEKLATIGKLTAGIIHEINNPLTIIFGNAGLLRNLIENEKLNKESALKIADALDTSAKRMSGVIANFKNFAHNSHMNKKEPFLIIDSFKMAQEIWRENYGHSGIELKYKIPIDLQLCGSEVEISQVFLNLLVNSSDEIENSDEKWISILAKKEKKQLIITFTDSGKGIPPKVAKKIFEPFYTTKEQGKGTGLGLSICQKIIENHQGEILIDDSKENTTFNLTFRVDS